MAGAADEILADLAAESGELDRLVADLTADRWRAGTPAVGWSVAHQIAHLAWTDERALLAVRDEAAFRREVESAVAAGGRLDRFVDEGAEQGAAQPRAELLARWRNGRDELARVLAALPKDHRIPWYGPPMGAAGMATARLMETWAHGEDVAAALGVRREPTDRLRHVAWLGARTRDFAYVVHGLEPPKEPFRVELTAPTSAPAAPAPPTATTPTPGHGTASTTAATWAYGPEEAGQRVTGPALDFCRLVTQRVHRDDTNLRAEGADAERWLGIAQAFAGPPGAGRPSRTGGAR